MTANETKLKKDVLEAKNTQREVEKIVDRIVYKDREVESEESKKQKEKYKLMNDSYNGLLIVSLITNVFCIFERLINSSTLENEFSTFYKTALHCARSIYSRFDRLVESIVNMDCHIVIQMFIAILLSCVFFSIGVGAVLGIEYFFYWLKAKKYYDFVSFCIVYFLIAVVVLFSDFLSKLPINLLLLILILFPLIELVRSNFDYKV